MSYREENGQVILTMSREDYGEMIRAVRQLARFKVRSPQRMLQLTLLAQRLETISPKNSNLCGKNMGNDLLVIPCDLSENHEGPCERNVWPVNSGNPNYTPHQVEEKKS